VKKSAHNRRRRLDADADAEEAGDLRPLAAGLAPGNAGDDGLEADQIGDSVLSVIERLRPHTGAILTVAGAALAAMVAFVVVSSQAEARRAESWEGCMAALSRGDLAAFSDVARRFPGTDAGRWAELLVADAAAADGADLLFVDRQRAEGRLRTAVDTYSALMQSRPSGLLAERIVFGLAKARESLGQIDESRRGYESLAAEFPGDPIAKLAAARAKDLSRDTTRQWYNWFAGQKFAAAGTPPGAGVQPQSPPPDSQVDSQVDSPVAPPADAVPQPPAAGQP
jgi:hypothetical protein